MRRAWLGLAVCLAGGFAWLLVAPATAALQPGSLAPPFTVAAAKGGRPFTFELAAALKNGPVVLYFYPKSFTGTCTLEAHAFADAMPQFQQAGASVIGLSGDSIETQTTFSSQECRDTFPVGSDDGLAVAKSYDAALAVPGTAVGFARRVSFVIAPGGTILSTLADADAEPHIRNALAAVQRWRAGQAR